MIIIILFILFILMLMLSRYLDLIKEFDELSEDLDSCYNLIEDLKDEVSKLQEVNKEDNKKINLFEGDIDGN